jgi:hypothetical protein
MHYKNQNYLCVELNINLFYVFVVCGTCSFRPIGRPKNRWEDDVRKDLQTVKIKNGKKCVLNRDLWKTIVERTKTHIEL